MLCTDTIIRRITYSIVSTDVCHYLDSNQGEDRSGGKPRMTTTRAPDGRSGEGLQ